MTTLFMNIVYLIPKRANSVLFCIQQRAARESESFALTAVDVFFRKWQHWFQSFILSTRFICSFPKYADFISNIQLLKVC